MGTSIAGVYSSTLKDHAKKYLKKIVVISPVIFMKNTRGLLPTVAPLVELILQKLQALGLNRLFVKGSLERIIVENICVRTNKFLGICNALVNYFNGPSDQKPRDFSKEFLREWPDDVSVKTLRHFAQTISSGGKAPLFNYGAKYNNYLYKSSVPPEYDISGIQIPFHIVYGGRDSLAPKEDAELLYNTLTSEKTIHGVPHFNHVDFMFANNVVNDFFVYLLELLNK
ncbi:unnamed protein product [Brassicogethes aeneus]|uniref:Uncharacterized protein n=1 Tax=Brassicogethes aeneus TaxID=1431903 RepID=A0A9P0B4Y9_BRAAE|nr:unnamed protein product [Brassicogethes aeneus]